MILIGSVLVAAVVVGGGGVSVCVLHYGATPFSFQPPAFLCCTLFGGPPLLRVGRGAGCFISHVCLEPLWQNPTASTLA